MNDDLPVRRSETNLWSLLFSSNTYVGIWGETYVGFSLNTYENLRNFFFTSVNDTPILDTAYSAMQSETQVGNLSYEKVESLQIIILCIYIGICCYLCTCGTIGLQTFPPQIFRQFLSARFFATASGGYNRARTGHWQKITFQKYVHPKFWGIDLNFDIYMHIDIMDNMS